MFWPSAPNNFDVEDFAGFSNDRLATKDYPPPVRQQHNVSARGSHRGGRERVNNPGHLLRILKSLSQLRQIRASDLQDAEGGGGTMLGYSSHTTRVSSHHIPWNATINWTGLGT